jgi:predicted nucleic acid-binding protein
MTLDSTPVRRHETDASVIASFLLGETVVTNDRVLNHALQQASNIIGRRDISALDKFEMLAAYVLKSRREVLGKPED